eukprot:gene26528-32561_t
MTLQPNQVFILITKLFGEFDKAVDDLGLTKLDTFGDTYWAACDLQRPATAKDATRLVAL